MLVHSTAGHLRPISRSFRPKAEDEVGVDLQAGGTVKVVRIDPEDALVAEHTRCWLGAVGTVTAEPTHGEVWVEFPIACSEHGATGAVFRLGELEAQASS
jgi:hypothetical protein